MARRGLNLPLGKTRKWFRRFLVFSVLAAVYTLRVLWVSYVPSVAHIPYCHDIYTDFNSRLDQTYLNMFTRNLVVIGMPRDDIFPWDGYYFVYDERVYLTYRDAQSDLILNSMNKAVTSVANPNPIYKQVGPYNVREVRPASLENKPLLKLYWDWKDAEEAEDTRSVESYDAIENAWCDLMEAVVTPSPPIDSQNE